MKKIVVSLVLLGSTIFADYTKEDRIADMQAMEKGMADIQKGFLYNSNDLIQKGVATVRNHALTLQPPRIGEQFSPDQQYAFMFARKQQRKIDSHAAKVGIKFAKGDKYQAMQEYTKILKQCTACHIKLRKW